MLDLLASGWRLGLPWWLFIAVTGGAAATYGYLGRRWIHTGRVLPVMTRRTRHVVHGAGCDCRARAETARISRV